MGFEESFENMQPAEQGFEQPNNEEAIMASVKAKRSHRMNAHSRRDRMGRRGYSPDGESDVDIMSPDRPVRISEGRRPAAPAQGLVSDRSEFAYLYSNTEPQDVHMSSERSGRLDALAYNDQSGEQYDTILNDQSPEPMVRTRSAIGAVPENDFESIGYPSAADYGYPAYTQQEEAPVRNSRFSRRSSSENQEVEPQVNNNYYQPQPEPAYEPQEQPSYTDPMQNSYAQPEPAYVQPEQEYYRSEPAQTPARYPQQFYPPYAEEYPVYPQYPSYPQYPQPYPYGGYPQYPQPYPVYPQPYPVYPQPQYIQPAAPQIQPCVQLFVNTASQPYVVPQQYPAANAQPYPAANLPQQEIYQQPEQSAPAAQPVPQPAAQPEPVQAPPAYAAPESVSSPYSAPEPVSNPYSYSPAEPVNPYAYSAPEPAAEVYKAPEPAAEPFSYLPSEPTSYYQPEPAKQEETFSSDFLSGLRREDPAPRREIPADIQEMMLEDDNSAAVSKSSRFNRRKR